MGWLVGFVKEGRRLEALIAVRVWGNISVLG